VRARTAAHLAWSLWGLTVALVAAAFVLLFLTRHTAVPSGGTGRSGDLILPIAFLVYATVGAVVATRHASNPIGWIFCASGLSIGLWTFSREYSIYGLLTRPGSLPGRDLMLWLETWAWVPGGTLTATFLLLLFPTGRLLSRRWLIVAWLSGAGVALLAAGLAIAPGPTTDFPGIDNPYGVSSLPPSSGLGLLILIPVAAIIGSIASLVVRFRRSRGDERAQMKWFVLAAVVLVAVLIPVMLGPQQTPNVLTALMALAFGFVPIAAGIAILKYRLYDIDVVINKALVYGVLAAFITAVYFVVVAGIGALGSGWPLNGGPLSAVATAMIAVAFIPVRRWVQRLANRLVYGERATPYEVLSAFSGRLGDAYSTEDVVPRMVRLIAESTGAARTNVWLKVGRKLQLAGTWPVGPSSPPKPLDLPSERELPDFPPVEAPFPVLHQGDLLGAITVIPAPGEPLTGPQQKLISDLASQAGLVLRNVRLTEELKANLSELKASRQRIVSAQDAERRRLERNIHDGAQQQLVSLSVRLGLARALAAKDPTQVDGTLAELQAETQEALENLRDLARGIYPPLLADQGLVAALMSQSRKVSIPVAIGSDGVGRYPQEAEAAIYFCCLEALQNVTKYAQASRIEVRLWEGDGGLSFSVTDDGKGFDTAAISYGTGLQGMADRLAAQNGTLVVHSNPGEGTTVIGHVPVPSSLELGSDRN
jgi:signal transduction histidine kinase